MSRNYYKSFFMPSPPLTSRIARAHDALVEADESEGLSEDDLAELDTEPEEVFEDEESARESSFLPPELEDTPREQSLEDYRQFISESLYSYLAYLSRTPQARERVPFHIYKAIARGMENNLGLEDREHRFTHLLWRLAREFHDRMRREHKGYYKAPWGEIQLIEREPYMLLIERQAEMREQRPDYKRATLITSDSQAQDNQE